MKLLWMIAGWIAFALGAIGAVLPIMPTVPFLIVAAACFSRGSPRMHAWLLSLPHFGPAIESWEKDRTISLPAKRAATIAIVAAFGSSLIFAREKRFVQLTVLAIGVCVLIFIWTRPSTRAPTPHDGETLSKE